MTEMYRVEAAVLVDGPLMVDVFRAALRDWLGNASGGEALAVVVERVDDENTALFLQKKAEIEDGLAEVNAMFPEKKEG